MRLSRTRTTLLAALASMAAIALAYALANPYAAKTWVANAAWTWCALFALASSVRAAVTVPAGRGRWAWIVMSACCLLWLLPQLRLDYVMLGEHQRSGDLSDFGQFGYRLVF